MNKIQLFSVAHNKWNTLRYPDPFEITAFIYYNNGNRVSISLEILSSIALTVVVFCIVELEGLITKQRC